MEALSEGLLKEIERIDNTKELYGNIEIEVFGLDVGMQTRKGWDNTRYYATTGNKLTIESQIEIKNPISYFYGKLLFITLVYSMQVKSTGPLALRTGIEEAQVKSSDYMIYLISYLLKNTQEFILTEGDNLGILRSIERKLYNEL